MKKNIIIQINFKALKVFELQELYNYLAHQNPCCFLGFWG
jgi:hypothetical protein